MPQLVDDSRRLVVPRWRSFLTTARLGHLASAGPPSRQNKLPSFEVGEIEILQRAWEDRKSPGHAADLVDAALVVQTPEIAVEAASFLLEASLSPLSVMMAQEVLSPSESVVSWADPQRLDRHDRYREIAKIKHLLRRHPRNAVAWVDLARHYSILGQDGPAENALIRALILAPNNRFVLRAGSRFFLHIRDPDKAHHLLRTSTRTRWDPWLLAAEVVAASAAGRSSTWTKEAQRMVEGGRFFPFDISELASALGTLEHHHGNRKGVRRFFGHALVKPTENTLAQAGWLARQREAVELKSRRGEVPRAYEAGAWEMFMEESYSDALRLAWKWLYDEPFASRPAIFGSWLAVTALGDLESGIRFMEAIEPSHPDDPRILSQLVFCKASQGLLSEAERLLGKLEGVVTSDARSEAFYRWEVLMAADRGLIAFRRGDTQEGRRQYREAIELAAKHRLHHLEAIAAIYFAREVRLSGAQDEAEILGEAEKALQHIAPPLRPAYGLLLRRPAETK